MTNLNSREFPPTKKIQDALSGTKNRKAVSTVLTTMIIMVASVVLATGIIFYGTSLFQAGAQSQSFSATNTVVWVDKTQNSGWAWGATAIRNSGDKILSVDTIMVRGTTVPFSNWYADTNPNRITTANFQHVMNYTTILGTASGSMSNGTAQGIGVPLGACPNANAAGTLIMELGTQSNSQTPPLCLTQRSGAISLDQGAKAIIYFKIPQNTLTAVDGGTNGNVAIYAAQVGQPLTVTVSSK